MENWFLFFNFRILVSENIVTSFYKKLRFLIKASFTTIVVATFSTGVLRWVIVVELTLAIFADLRTANPIFINLRDFGFALFERVSNITRKNGHAPFLIALLAKVRAAAFISTGVVFFCDCI
jgi:hypothetical protein